MARRHDDPATQTAYEQWNQAVLDRVDHRDGCEAGCSILADVCEIGQCYAAAEQRAWKLYHDVRQVEVTA